MHDSEKQEPIEVVNSFRSSLAMSEALIVQVSKRKSLKLLCRLTIDIVLFILSVFVTETYYNPILYLITVMFIGARLMGFASVGIHDGSHGLLLRNKYFNALFTKLTCLLMFMPFSIYKSYRAAHPKHHRHVNSKRDPSGAIFKSINNMSNRNFAILFLKSLSGLLFLKNLNQQLMTASAWQKNPYSTFYIVGLLIAIPIGAYLNYYPAYLALFYWLIPVMTWGQVANLIRMMAEHYCDGNYQQRDSLMLPSVLRTRDVATTVFDKLFFVTHNVNFHFTHHLFPQVPFYNLPKLHQALLTNERYQTDVHYIKGYHRFLKEFLFSRNKT